MLRSILISLSAGKRNIFNGSFTDLEDEYLSYFQQFRRTGQWNRDFRLLHSNREVSSALEVIWLRFAKTVAKFDRGGSCWYPESFLVEARRR